jgi:hypothetical protein
MMARNDVPQGIHGEKWIPPKKPQGPNELWDGMGPQLGLPKYRVVWPVGTWREREQRERAAYDEICESIDCELWGIEPGPDNFSAITRQQPGQSPGLLDKPPLDVFPGRICSPVSDDEPNERLSEEDLLLRVSFPDGRHSVKTQTDLRHEKEWKQNMPGAQVGPGRPRRYANDDLGQAQALVVGHANKWLDTYRGWLT